MPRGKKSKKDEQENDVENDIEEYDELEEPKKNIKKSSKSSKSSKSGKTLKKKGKKEGDPDEENDEEDELSDLPIDDIDAPVETNDQDEVITSKNDKLPYKIIDPKTQIGKLKPVEILDYLIQYGSENTNQTLRIGAILLKKKITGKYRRPNHGSKSNRGGPPRGFQPRGNYNTGYNSNYSGNHNGGRNFKNQHRGPSTNEDLYGNND